MLSLRRAAVLMPALLVATFVAGSITVADAGTPSQLTVSAPVHSARGVTLTITGRLKSGNADVPNAPLTVTDTDLDGRHTVAAGTTTSPTDGTFSFTDKPAVGGANKYTIKFAGDGTHNAASKSVTIQVSRHKTAISIASGRKSYPYGRLLVLHVHLGHTYSRRFVSVYLHPVGGRRTLGVRARVDSHGRLGVDTKIYRNTTYTVVFAGDERYAPVSAHIYRKAHVKVVTKFSGSYGRSGKYHLFHAGKKGTFEAAVEPRKAAGKRVFFSFERQENGRWVTVANPNYAVNKKGVVAVTFEGFTNRHYRLRASYHRDKQNLSGRSAWRYAQFR